jgi:hypothetical protein
MYSLARIQAHICVVDNTQTGNYTQTTTLPGDGAEGLHM